MKITFTNTFDIDLQRFEPLPASKLLPEWYKQTQSYYGDQKKKPAGNGHTTSTIKRCVPVFDAITAGYIITSYCDIYISQKDGAPWYEWPGFNPIDFHPITQADLHPSQNGFSFPKWINPWSISTPKGYSVLFTAPMHRENSPFTCMPGVVDTDTYTPPVNFPFTLNDPTFEGLIPAGTPLVQVIPFKRDSWDKQIGTKKDLDAQDKVQKSLRMFFFDNYRNRFWDRKKFN
jgi:hypothetical protein